MTSRHGVRPLRLMVIAAVIALLSTLFAATAAHAGTGSITGKVTKPTGKAFAGTVVDLYSIDSDDYIWFEKSVNTRSDGTYTFGSLDRGHYIVGFGAESPGYAAEFWNNKTMIENAAAISVGSSRVSSINARLAVGGKATGRVLTDSPSPRPVAGVEVAAYRLDGAEWTFGKSVLTSSDGSFAVGGLSEGEWSLEFNPPFEGPDADLALEYWDNNRSFSTDDTFNLQLGQTVTGKDARLSPGGRISGRVTGPNGEPVVDALVFGNPGPEGFGNFTFTDENGNYVMTGLSPGQHRLRFDSFEFDGPFGDEGYASEWWDDRESFAVADPITVEAGVTTSGKNVQLDLASTPLLNTTAPSITGTPKVGETLTADPGAWTPRISDGTFEYQWFDGDTAIEGADRKTFIPSADHLGRSISVEVTASRSGNTTSAMSAPTAPLAKGVLTPDQYPSLNMPDPRVGQRVVGTSSRWSPSVEYTTEFLADGVPFAYDNAEGLPAGVLGKKVSIRQTSTSPAYETATLTSSETAPVGLGKFDTPTTASISGVAIVGEPLETTLAGTVAGADYQYQWLAGGAEISDADQPTYTPTSAEVGKSLSVRLSMTKPGYSPAESTSGPTDPVVASGSLHVTPGTPTISGTPRIGQTLTASSGTWAPTGVQFTYEWLADGATIPDASASTLTLTPAQSGKKIAVKVTGSKSGYTSGSATSAETNQTSTPFGAPQDLAAPSSTPTTIGLSWTEVEGAAKYRISYGIGTGTRTRFDVGDVTSTTIKKLKPGTEYSISIAALRSDGTRSPYAPRIYATTDPFLPPTNLASPGATTSTIDVTWTKAPDATGYRISYGIGNSTTRTRIDVGNVSSRKLTGLTSGVLYTISIAALLPDGTKSSYTPRITVSTLEP